MNIRKSERRGERERANNNNNTNKIKSADRYILTTLIERACGNIRGRISFIKSLRYLVIHSP